MPIRNLVADDHVMVRQGLHALLEQVGMAVMGEASDGQEALRVAHAQHPDVAILDLAMPHVHGLETARRLREAVPQTTIVLLIVHTEDPYVFEALPAGLVGYVVKTQVAVDLVEALREVLQGMISVSPRVAGAVVQASLTTADLPLDPLTSREFEIVQRLAEGQTTKAIAYRLGLRVKTVESHRLHLMRKLDMHETATRVRYAIRRGLILP